MCLHFGNWDFGNEPEVVFRQETARVCPYLVALPGARDTLSCWQPTVSSAHTEGVNAFSSFGWTLKMRSGFQA